MPYSKKEKEAFNKEMDEHIEKLRREGCIVCR